MADLSPTITATLSESESLVVKATSEGKPGHYVATLDFSKEGNWSWSIQAFTMDQAMPEISVASESRSAASTPRESAPITALLIVRILALGIGLTGLFIAYQRRSRLAGGLAVLCLLIGVGSFVTGSGIPVGVEAQSKTSAAAAVNSSIPPAELGRQLFIAKGCITCHVNTKVEAVSTHWTIDVGAPDLSKFSASPEALRLRLKDPTLVKSDTQMPNLHLADDEIEALIAFINSK